MDSSSGDRQAHKLRRVADKDRKRAARACDGCRRLKEKCHGGVPCRRCTRLHRPCEFTGHEIAFGYPVASQQDTAERSHPHVAVDGETSQRLKHMETIIKHYVGNVTLDSETLKDLAQSIERESPSPRPDQASPGSEGHLGPEKESFTVQPLPNNITHYSGEFSHWNFSMRIKQWIEQHAQDQDHLDGPAPLSFKEYYRPEELQYASDAFTSILSSLPPRDVTDFLVEAFFRQAETNYWYVERGWLHDKLDIAYATPASFTRRDVGTVCTIFIILATGTQYAYLDSHPRPQPNDQTGPFSEDILGVMFFQQACKLVPDVIALSSLESVQACLLIGIYTLPLDASGLSYIYLNLAVKLAILNGMHREYPGNGLDPIVKETRSRVWWTAYTMERRVGIFHGRPTTISRADVDAELPMVQHPDIRPTSAPSQIQTMLATIRLHDILGRILREMSTFNMATKSGISNALGRLVDLKGSIGRWWSAIPDQVCRKSLPPSPSSNHITRREAHLRLEYCLVRMFSGRPFIFLRVPGLGGTPSSGSPTDEPLRPSRSRPSRTQAKRDLRSELVTDCVEAALEAIDTCKALQDGAGAARASYTEFSGCRAALLVIIAQCIHEKTERLHQSLKDGVAMIKSMSSGGESARSEASLIEVLERAISRLDDADDAPNPCARFKKWEMLWKNDTPAFGSRGSSLHKPDGTPLADTPGLGQPPEIITGGPWGDSQVDLGSLGPAAQAAQAMAAAPWVAPTAQSWDFMSFPQTMDEFSNIFRSDYGPIEDNVAIKGANSWMMGD